MTNKYSDLTVIIAVRCNDKRLHDSVASVRNSFSNVILVSRPDSIVDELATTMDVQRITNDSPNDENLWLAGIQESSTSWFLLIRSSEIVTASLKNSIIEKTATTSNELCVYPLHHISIFLRKRLKYQLDWTGEFPSALLRIPTSGKIDELKNIRRKKSALKGSVLNVREESLSEIHERVAQLSEMRANRLYEQGISCSKTALVFKGIFSSMNNFFRNYFVKKGFKEGFEGFVFSLADALATLWGYVRYFDFLRTGRQIADQLDSIKKILVIKTRGVGDNVIFTPFLRNIKYRLPNVSLSVLTQEFSKPVLEANPNIDHLYGIPRGFGKEALAKLDDELSKEQFDLIINLHAKSTGNDISINSVSITQNIAARWRINSSYFHRDKETDVMVGMRDPHCSHIERELDCLRSIGIQPKDKHTEIFVKEEETEWAKNYLVEKGFDLNRKLIIVHPFSSDELRSWGLERYIQLCHKLHSDSNHQILITCDENEAKEMEETLKTHPHMILFTGSLRELMALTKESDLMIDNDSGPSHLSEALGVPTLLLQGPLLKDLYRDKDLYREKHYIFYKEVPCRDVMASQCVAGTHPVTGRPTCLDKICNDFSVDEVFDQALKMLHEK